MCVYAFTRDDGGVRPGACRAIRRRPSSPHTHTRAHTHGRDKRARVQFTIFAPFARSRRTTTSMKKNIKNGKKKITRGKNTKNLQNISSRSHWPHAHTSNGGDNDRWYTDERNAQNKTYTTVWSSERAGARVSTTVCVRACVYKIIFITYTCTNFCIRKIYLRIRVHVCVCTNIFIQTRVYGKTTATTAVQLIRVHTTTSSCSYLSVCNAHTERTHRGGGGGSYYLVISRRK